MTVLFRVLLTVCLISPSYALSKGKLDFSMAGTHHLKLVINDNEEIYPVYMEIEVYKDGSMNGNIEYRTLDCTGRIKNVEVVGDGIYINEKIIDGIENCDPSKYLIIKSNNIHSDIGVSIFSLYDGEQFQAEISSYRHESSNDKIMKGVAVLAGITAGALLVKWLVSDSTEVKSNQKPTAQNVTQDARMNDRYTYDLARNIDDAETSDESLKIIVVSKPKYGALTWKTNSEFTYEAIKSSRYVGDDQFIYKVADEQFSYSHKKTVTIKNIKYH
jgi:hypothetical protein